MKKILLVFLLIFGFTIFGFSQGVNPRIKRKIAAKSKMKVDPLIVEAEKAWIPFYKTFREIIKHKDKESLKEIMTDDFNSTFGEKKAEYLKNLLTEDHDGWMELGDMKKVSNLLKKGELISGVGRIERTPTRIVSEFWYGGKERSVCRNSKQYSKSSCGADGFLFEFRDNNWLLVSTTFCECE